MIDQEDKEVRIIKYGSETSFVHRWIILIWVFVALAVILSHGIAVYAGPSYFLFPYFLTDVERYTVDPLISTFVGNSAPLIFRLFSLNFDIPFIHLLVGSVSKFVLVGVFYALAWRITRSSLASLIAVLILFGVADFKVGSYHMLNLRLPIGFTSNELRMPIYLSYRQIGMIFAIASTLFFLQKRFILSSVILAGGVYFHAINSMGFFLCLNLTLLICFFPKANRMEIFYAMIKFSIPFLLIIFPFVFRSMNALADVVPMDFSSYWAFMLKNEPDDASTLWYVSYFKSLYLIGLLLTLVASALHVIHKASKPIQPKLSWAMVFDYRDMVLPLLAASWILLAFGVFWEMALIPFAPDFINDTVSTLNLKRVTTLSALIYIPILSVPLSNIILLLVKTVSQEILTDGRIDRLKNKIKEVGLASGEHALGVILAIFILFYVLVLDNKQIRTFNKFVNFNHVEFDYYLEDKARASKIVGTRKSETPIPLSALLETCDWVKKNTPLDSALIHPTFMLDIRVHCKRQAFLSEKEDGNLSLVNRKFATLYLQRFADIHKGLTYDDLPAIELGADNTYSFLRQRYLSLFESDIEGLRKKYPGYDYFLTETSHDLNYPVLYENEFFRLFDIS